MIFIPPKSDGDRCGCATKALSRDLYGTDIRQNLLKKKKKSAHVVFKNNSSTGGEAPSAFIPQM